MSRTAIIELRPRRPADGIEVPVRLAHNVRQAAHFFSETWRPLVLAMPTFDANLGWDGSMFGRRAAPTVGSLVAGTDPAWQGLVWEGAACSIRRADWPASERDPLDGAFGPQELYRVDGVSFEGDIATIQLRDMSQPLEQPATAMRFGSSGVAVLDSTDTVDLKGKVVPTGWGRMGNVPGYLVDRANNIWLLLGRPSTAIHGLYDGGAAWTAGVSRPSLAALIANPPAVATVDVCLDAGGLTLCRPWTAPAYPLTADLTATGATAVAGIVAAIVGARAPALSFVAGTVAAHDALQPAVSGIYIDDERSIAECLDWLLMALGSWWQMTEGGQIEIGRFDWTAPALTLQAHQAPTIRRKRVVLPTRHRAVGWAHNNKVMGEGEIATALLAGDIDGLGDLAFEDQVDWSSQISGVGKPEDGATRNAVRGVHSSALVYAAGDWVRNAAGDELWAAIVAVPAGITLGDLAYWSLMLESGGGAPGINSATILLYQRTATATPPATPTGTLTYTFATMALSGSLGGWSRALPATGPAYSWVISASVSAAAATDDIAPGEWAAPALQGTAAMNVDTVFLYARAAAAPAAPAVTLTYTFATRALSSGSLGAWSQTIPAVDGHPLWVRTASALSADPTDSIAAAEWSAATMLTQDGADGRPAFSVTPTLPTWAVRCAANGTPAPSAFGGANGVLRCHYNGADVTASCTFVLSDTIDATGEVWSGGVYYVTGLMAETGRFTLTASYDPPGADPAVSASVDITAFKARAGSAAIEARDDSIARATSTSMMAISTALVIPAGPGGSVQFSGWCSYVGTGASGSCAVRLQAFYRLAGSGGAWIAASAYVEGTATWLDPIDGWQFGGASYSVSVTAPVAQEIWECALFAQKTTGLVLSTPGWAGSFSVSRAS